MKKQVVSRRPSTISCAASTTSLSRKVTLDRFSDTASILTSTTGSNGTIQGDSEYGSPMYFAELNPFAPNSIVLLHALYTSSLEWKQVCPKLHSYHLLVPDLPGHSRSRNVCRREDFTFELCADYIADMIRKHAHDGRAHIVGMSMGGFIAMEVIRKYPDLVLSAFICGAWPYKGLRAWAAKSPRVIYSGLWSILHSPGYSFFKASGLGGEYQNDDLLSEIKKNGSFRLTKAASVGHWNKERLREVGRARRERRGFRLCFVAEGTAGAEIMTEIKEAVETLSSENMDGEGIDPSAFLVQDAIHIWNLQFPKLFARGIAAWIEGRSMPAEFEPILYNN